MHGDHGWGQQGTIEYGRQRYLAWPAAGPRGPQRGRQSPPAARGRVPAPACAPPPFIKACSHFIVFPGGRSPSVFPPSPIKRALAQAHILGPGRPLNFLGRGGRRFAAGAIKVELPPLRCVKLWGLRILRSLRRQLRKNTCDTATQLQAHLTLTRTFNACCLLQHGAKLLRGEGPKLLPPLVSDLADRCMPESRERTRAHMSPSSNT